MKTWYNLCRICKAHVHPDAVECPYCGSSLSIVDKCNVDKRVVK